MAPLFDERLLTTLLFDVFIKAHAKEARGRFNVIFTRNDTDSTTKGVLLGNLPITEVRCQTQRQKKRVV